MKVGIDQTICWGLSRQGSFWASVYCWTATVYCWTATVIGSGQLVLAREEGSYLLLVKFLQAFIYFIAYSIYDFEILEGLELKYLIQMH